MGSYIIETVETAVVICGKIFWCQPR